MTAPYPPPEWGHDRTHTMPQPAVQNPHAPPQHTYEPLPPPKRKRRRWTWVLLAVLGAIVIIIAVGLMTGSNAVTHPHYGQKAAGPAASSSAVMRTPAPAPTPPPPPVAAPKPPPPPPAPMLTAGQQNAIRAAKQYLNVMAFSRAGLINQLKFDGYTPEDATFAVDNIAPDWMMQATRSAKQYVATMPFSHAGLVKQLEFDGYTPEQAEAGTVGAGL